MNMESLTKIYAAYCEREGIRPMSADEALLEDITEANREWLQRFIQIWDRLLDSDRQIYLPAPAKRMIMEGRKDIEFIHYDQGWFESFLNCWMIPCEAKIDGEWMHGTMTVEWVESESTYDYSVGDWDYGMNPDLHTFER